MLINNLKDKYPNNKLIAFWTNRRYRSIIYLLFWIIFILLVYFIYLKPIENYKKDSLLNNEKEDTLKETRLDKYKDNLLNYNFAFIYTVSNTNNQIIYQGERLSGQSIYTKKENELIQKYYTNNEEYYLVNDGNLEPVDADLLYETYLNVGYIFLLIEDQEPIISENSYVFQINNIYVRIEIGIDNISVIEVNVNNNNNYILEFSNINNITKIVY